jgi:hypothetical protein
MLWIQSLATSSGPEAQKIRKVFRDERMFSPELGCVGFFDCLHNSMAQLLNVHCVARGYFIP